jgi:hypothetical protein
MITGSAHDRFQATYLFDHQRRRQYNARCFSTNLIRLLSTRGASCLMCTLTPSFVRKSLPDFLETSAYHDGTYERYDKEIVDTMILWCIFSFLFMGDFCLLYCLLLLSLVSGP